MESLLDALSAKVGQKGTPLSKISFKDKKELKATLNELQRTTHDISNELLLRAYLLSGENPDSAIRSADIITKALTFKDVLQKADKLTSKIIAADGKYLFTAIKIFLGQDRKATVNQATIKSVIRCIQKWQQKVVLLKGRLTDGTEQSIIALINVLALRMSPPRNLDTKIVTKFKSVLRPLFELLFWVTVRSISYETYNLAFQTTSMIIKRFPSLIVNDLLAEESLSNEVEMFKQNMLDKVESIVSIGNVEQLADFNTVIDESLNMRQSFIGNIRKLWDSRGATFNRETQQLIKNIILNESTVNKSFELTKENEKSSIRQLAGALIISWEARNDGPLALNSFKLLSSVAERFFNLKIGGDIGSKVSFNRITHEAPSNTVLTGSAKVELIRPWVEWDGEERTVLIKALVKPQ